MPTHYVSDFAGDRDDDSDEVPAEPEPVTAKVLTAPAKAPKAASSAKVVAKDKQT